MDDERMTLDWALQYRRQGFSCIPVDSRNKGGPPFSWKPYQKRLPTEEELRRWAEQYPQHGLAIITGQVSGVVVLDQDRHGEDDGVQVAKSLYDFDSQDYPCVETGGGGYHTYFKHPGSAVKNMTASGAIAPGLELKGDGGFVYAPPSVHPSGQAYRWITAPWDWEGELPAPPPWLTEVIQKQQTTAGQSSGRLPGEQGDAVDKVTLALMAPIPEHGNEYFAGRNEAATVVAGYFVRVMGEPQRARAAFLAWNQSNCKPPLPRREAEKVFRSIARRDAILNGKPPPEGERDIAPEDDEERELMLQALRDRFGIPLDDITRIGGSSPVYRFVCGDSVVNIPARRLENQGNFRRAMIEATERVPAKIGSKANPGWDHYLQQMLNVARRMDPGEEAYERGQLKAWVGRYLEINDIRDAAEPTDIPEMPCRSDGRVCLHLESFRRFVEVEFGVTPNAMELAQKLTAEGFERNTLNVKLGGGGRTTRSMWAVPEEWEGEY